LYNTSIKLKGCVSLFGDKSISHRLLMIGALINKESEIYNLSNSDDVLATIECLRKCNISIKSSNNNVKILGGNLRSPSKVLNCRNSGTTVRLLLGLLAGQEISAEFTGDISLLNRPMKRIINPLITMGASIESNKYMLPVKMKKNKLKSIDYKIKTKSAQVKSSLMFAALGCETYSHISYNLHTRNHTEKILNYLNCDLKINDRMHIKKSTINTGFSLVVPGDISSASFIIAGAILLPGSEVVINDILYNKSRLGFINFLKKMNANICIKNINNDTFESTCSIIASYSPNLRSAKINPNNIIDLIDEIPILAIIATQCKGVTIINGTQELKYKESDRAAAIYKNLKNMGADIKYSEDKITINGRNKLYNTTIIHENDHRIAMSFELLHLLLNNKLSYKFKKIISASFPDFYSKFDDLIS